MRTGRSRFPGKFGECTHRRGWEGKGGKCVGPFKFDAWVCRVTSGGNEKKREWDREGQWRRNGEDERGKRMRMAVRAFRARLRLLKRNREKKGRKRGRGRGREEKRRYKERGNRTRRVGALRGGEERKGKPRLQHCKRQRCTLPGGRSDNIYRGPPATMPIFRVGWEGEGEPNSEKDRGEREVGVSPSPTRSAPK